MAAPTELTTSVPYDRFTLTRLKEKLGVVFWGAKTFASLTSEQQADILEIIDDGSDLIASKCFGNQAWYRRTIAAGITLVADQATYEMPSDCKRLEVLKEVIGGETREIPFLDEATYELLWGTSLRAEHPISGSDVVVRYTARGFSTDQKLIIQRIPTPSSTEAGGKLYPLYVPYDEKYSNDADVILVPSARRALMAYCQYVMSAKADPGGAAAARWEREFEKECQVLQRHEGRVSGEPDEIGLDGTFTMEMQGP